MSVIAQNLNLTETVSYIQEKIKMYGALEGEYYEFYCSPYGESELYIYKPGGYSDGSTMVTRAKFNLKDIEVVELQDWSDNPTIIIQCGVGDFLIKKMYGRQTTDANGKLLNKFSGSEIRMSGHVIILSSKEEAIKLCKAFMHLKTLITKDPFE